MTMRRVVKASICAVVFWFGVMEFGGGMLYKGEAARSLKETAFTQTLSHQYEATPLLGVPTVDDPAGNPEEDALNNEADHHNALPETGSKQEKEDSRQSNRQAESNDLNAGSDTASKQSSQYFDPIPAVENKSADNGKVIYLTIDDGPSKHTPEVLDILKREGVQATFFVLGEQVERNPDIAKRIVEEGHAIGNHTYNHQYDKLYGSFSEFANQVMRTDDEIYAATGVRTTLVRAPGGTHTNFDQGYFDALGAAGYRVHDWNVDSGDSKRRGVPSSEIIANIKKSKLADTLNVLIHDSAGHEESVRALPAIIQYYKSLGYSFEPLDDSVKPMQFQLASKPKWARGKVTEGERAAIVNFGKELEASGARQLSNVREPVLTVHRGEETLMLRAGQYSLKAGSIYVPLNQLVEWMGGTAEQDEQSGVVEASLSGKKLFWMKDSLSSPGGADNRFMDVPLRSTLGEFGIDIEDYNMSKDHREVWIKQ